MSDSCVAHHYRETKQTIFVLPNKTRFNTLLHSVRRQSINKLYNYGLILRQTTIVFASVFLWDWKHNYVLYQGDKREGMKGALSYLADDKKMTTNTHIATCIHPTRVQTEHANTYSEQICLKSDRSFTLSLHSS